MFSRNLKNISNPQIFRCSKPILSASYRFYSSNYLNSFMDVNCKLK